MGPGSAQVLNRTRELMLLHWRQPTRLVIPGGGTFKAGIIGAQYYTGTGSVWCGAVTMAHDAIVVCVWREPGEGATTATQCAM